MFCFLYVGIFLVILVMIEHFKVGSQVIGYVRVHVLMLCFFLYFCSLLDILTNHLWVHFLKSTLLSFWSVFQLNIKILIST